MKYRYIAFLISLLSVLQLRAQVPDWSVQPADYTNSMVVIGVLSMDGVESLDANDKIAAFVNAECRGLSSPFYEASVDRYISYLFVYSNQLNDSISFKMYDADRDTLIEVHAHLEFIPDKLMGDPLSPYIWTSEVLNSEAGLWSLSFPEQLGSTDINGNSFQVFVPKGSNVTRLVADFTTSPGARVTVNGHLQASGLTKNDFSNPLIYKVSSEDYQTTVEYAITVTVDSSFSISGEVSPANSGLVTGTGSYNSEQTITLTATPFPGYSFANWTEEGVIVSTQASYSFTINTDRILVANFAEIVGVNDLEGNNAVFMYPNPSKGRFTIGLKNNYRGEITIRIYSIGGSQSETLILNKDLPEQNYPIDLDNYIPGFYLVEITGSRTKITKKILIN